jgi:flagellin
MTINTNIASLLGQTALKQSQARSATALQRLSTGLRINSPADDPAGSIAATGLNSEITKLAAQQSGDDRLYIKGAFAEGVLGAVSGVLQHAKSLTVQNASRATLTDTQRDANQRVFDAIVSGIERLGVGTTFLGEHLFGPNVQLQSDASGASTTTGNLDPTQLGAVFDPFSGETYSLADLQTGGMLADNVNPELSAKVVDAAIKQITGVRADLGDFQNTLKTMGNVRDVTRENLSSALSQIEDTDYATEMLAFTRNQMLSQTATSATAIANRAPQRALDLLAH